MTFISNHKHIALFLLAGSVGPLVFALVSQYGFGLHPCHLCIVQRVPYAAIVALGFFCWFLGHHRPFLLSYVGAAIVLWITEAVIALYHTGVELGWFEGSDGCVADTSAGQSLDELRAAILGSPIVSCTDVAAEFLGLSMAAWNGLLALSLAAIGTYLFVIIKRNFAT